MLLKVSNMHLNMYQKFEIFLVRCTGCTSKMHSIQGAKASLEIHLFSLDLENDLEYSDEAFHMVVTVMRLPFYKLLHRLSPPGAKIRGYVSTFVKENMLRY